MLQLVNKLKVIPQIQMSSLASCYNVTVEFSHAHILGISKGIEITVDEGVSAYLPVAQMNMSASNELLAVTFKLHSADITDDPIPTVGQSHSS